MQTHFYIFRQNYYTNTYTPTKLYKNIFPAHSLFLDIYTLLVNNRDISHLILFGNFFSTNIAKLQ